jgi:hypothetical protein
VIGVKQGQEKIALLFLAFAELVNKNMRAHGHISFFREIKEGSLFVVREQNVIVNF